MEENKILLPEAQREAMVNRINFINEVDKNQLVDIHNVCHILNIGSPDKYNTESIIRFLKSTLILRADTMPVYQRKQSSWFRVHPQFVNGTNVFSLSLTQRGIYQLKDMLEPEFFVFDDRKLKKS